MDRTGFKTYKEKRIYFIDLTDCSPEEGLQIVKEADNRLKDEAENSLLIIINVKGASFNKGLVQALKELAVNTKKSSKKAAVVGVEGIQKVIYHAVMNYSERNLPIFNTLEEAKEWIIED